MSSPKYDALTEGLPGDRRSEKLSLLDRVKSAATWTSAVSWLAPTAGALTVAHQLLPVEKLDKPERLFCSGMMFFSGARPRYFVDPAIRSDEQYLFVQNHVNHLDFVFINNAVPHVVQGVELETHFNYPFYGWYMKGRGTVGVPADKEKRFEGTKANIKKTIERGHSVLIFPEGTRTLNGRVGTFRRGAFAMARDLGLKVVPVSVTGAYALMRKGNNALIPGQRLDMYFDAPVDFAGLSDEELPAKMDEVRQTMCRRVDTWFEEWTGKPLPELP